MRREDREITEKIRLREIMASCRVCSIAFSGEDCPYVIPLNFGFCWEDDMPVLYFHGASQGRKLECMDRDNRVAFCMAAEKELKIQQPACGSTMLYASICGTGRLYRVEDRKEKIRGLTAIMRQYDRKSESFEFSEETAGMTQVLRLEVESLSGKSNWMNRPGAAEKTEEDS